MPGSSTRVRQRVLRPADRRPGGPGAGAAHRIRARGGLRGDRAGHAADHARRHGRRTVEELYRFYHVPGSNTAVGHLVLRPAGAARPGRELAHADRTRRGRRVRHQAPGRRWPPSTASPSRRWSAAGWSRPRRSRRSTAPATPRPTWPRPSPATTSTRSSWARRPSCTREQAIAAMRAGKHVQVEIPLADSWAGRASGRPRAAGDRPGLHGRAHPPVQPVAPVDPPRIGAGELSIQQMDVQTYFFRRTNMNALGQPRSWTDHLLWHHAAHTVDLFQYQTGEDVADRPRRAGADPPRARHRHGHVHPAAHARAAAICTLSLSFNNDGPLGTFFRYICDNGTYIARYDDLVTGREEPIDVSRVDVSTNGIELQDREFVAAIREGREPNASVARRAALLPGARRAGGPARRAAVAGMTEPLALAASLEGPAGAPVLVLGNSLGTTGEVWEPQAAALGERFRLLRFEHRGPRRVARAARALHDRRTGRGRAAAAGRLRGAGRLLLRHLAGRDDRDVAGGTRAGTDRRARGLLHVRLPAAAPGSGPTGRRRRGRRDGVAGRAGR